MDLFVLARTFGLIGLAELGDKSLFVCMALAGRYRTAPVILGAALAFSALNGVAVVFGATLGSVLPHDWVVWLAGALFLGFGVQGWLSSGEEDDEEVEPPGGMSAVGATMSLLVMAELGDKTQLAVAGLASTYDPLPVWLGATLALTCTSMLGVGVGWWLRERVAPVLLQRLGSTLFLVFGLSLWIWG